MYQFFVESGQIGKDSVMIEGSDVNHIKNVLRMKPGEKIRISGPARENYFCEIAEIEDSFVRASILEKDETGMISYTPSSTAFWMISSILSFFGSP